MFLLFLKNLDEGDNVHQTIKQLNIMQVEDLKQNTAKFDIRTYIIIITNILIQYVKGVLERFDSCSLRRGILFIFRQIKLIKSCFRFITLYIFI